MAPRARSCRCHRSHAALDAHHETPFVQVQQTSNRRCGPRRAPPCAPTWGARGDPRAQRGARHRGRDVAVLLNRLRLFESSRWPPICRCSPGPAGPCRLAGSCFFTTSPPQGSWPQRSRPRLGLVPSSSPWPQRDTAQARRHLPASPSWHGGFAAGPCAPRSRGTRWTGTAADLRAVLPTLSSRRADASRRGRARH